MPLTIKVLFWAFGVSSAVALASLVLFRPRPSRGPGLEDVAHMQMQRLRDGAQLYYLDHRVLPKSLDVLTNVSRRTGEPYVEAIPLDPWNRPYEYAVIESGRREFRVRSLGPDGRRDTDDDLSSPAPD
jgi:hypothetical protein